MYAIFTTGIHDVYGYITKYNLTWSEDNINFNQLLRDDNSAIFDGTTEQYVRVKNYFLSPIEARYVRLDVVECENTDPEVAINWGLLGNPGKKNVRFSVHKTIILGFFALLHGRSQPKSLCRLNLKRFDGISPKF